MRRLTEVGEYTKKIHVFCENGITFALYHIIGPLLSNVYDFRTITLEGGTRPQELHHSRRARKPVTRGIVCTRNSLIYHISHQTASKFTEKSIQMHGK